MAITKIQIKEIEQKDKIKKELLKENKDVLKRTEQKLPK